MSQFNLNVQHCSNKIHFVSDILLRLLDNINIKNDDIDILDNIEFYHIILVKITDEFKQQIQNTYKEDSLWKWIFNLIKLTNHSWWNQYNNNENTVKRSADLQFMYHNDLIYYIDDVDDWECLCILVHFKKEIFKLIHNCQHHDEFHHTYDHIAVSLFLHHLIRHLKTYILHCSECQLNQMKQYVSYGLLQSIITSSISFHTIIMNFVLTLSVSSSLYKYDNLLTVTDKFTKWVLLLLSKSIYTTVN